MKSLKEVHTKLDHARKALDGMVVGQPETTKQLLVALLCNQHALLESVPGLGKTTLVKSAADIMKLDFSRIQNTPDLMPSDILGTLMVFENRGKQVLRFQKGPIFANIVLADEINRATPKTQAAMLEAMQEKQITVAGTTYPLEEPFFVLATQNPIDQEGTYPLPEAQTDRFLLKILVEYPKVDSEVDIVLMNTGDSKSRKKVVPVLSKKDVVDLQQVTVQTPISKELQAQIVKFVQKTREFTKYIKVGASPRASIGLVMAAKAHALLSGNNHVTRSDVLAMAAPVLRHRLLLTFAAEEEGKSADELINDLAKTVIKAN